MSLIFAGTAYNQVLTFATDDKKNQKIAYGPMSRQTVTHINYFPPLDYLFYSTPKELNFVQQNKETIRLTSTGDHKIIGLDYDADYNNLRYTMSNGGVNGIAINQEGEVTEPVILFKGQSHNQYLGSVETSNREQYLFYGKGIVPIIAHLPNGQIGWKGRNVKHDELDLQVPIHDVDASFIRDQKFHAILNAKNKLRIYDIRGTNRRPCSDILLKTTPKATMTKMKISQCQNYYFLSNDIGQIFQCDSRKNWQPVGKFKGITTTITDMVISNKYLVTASLDCFVRMFDIETKEIVKKYYLNKPVHSLDVIFPEEEEEEKFEAGDFKEEEIDLGEVDEEEEKKVPKVKQIRKRNKVGLKYLQPREFDEIDIKQEEQIKKEEWYQKLNPIDRRDFQ